MSALPIPTPQTPATTTSHRIKVLIVDDSAVVREMLNRSLSACADIEVVGTAPDPFVARDKIIKLNPDVLTLDVEMPRMDGITFLGKIMSMRPMPVIIISSLTAEGTVTSVKALQAGAVEVLHKPGPMDPPEHLALELPNKIRAAAKARFPGFKPKSAVASATTTAPLRPADHAVSSHPLAHVGNVATPTLNAGPYKRIIAVGASTGGVQALTAFLTQFPEDCPPVVVVQHMPPKFTATFAQRLNEVCKCSVSEGKEGDLLRPGHVYLAPGGKHMIVRHSGSQMLISLKDGPPVFHQKPAVEVLFDSVTRITTTTGKGQHNAVGVILTGMGADGAAALLRMRQAGARTFAEDESTAIVYGMPAEAAKLGAAEKIFPLHELPRHVLNAAKT